MSKKVIFMCIAVGLLLVIGASFLAWQKASSKRVDSRQSKNTDRQLASPLVNVTLPKLLTTQAKQGKEVYVNNCQSCHGVNAAGQAGVAPPLIHKIYEPSHHGDASFYRAIQSGVPSHHWRFGNMSPIKGINNQQVPDLIRYIRELQQANGIR